MKLLRLHAIEPNLELAPMAVTIGNFDGVHLGHQAMIEQLKQVAAAKNLKTLVMVFEPQPLEFFRAEQSPTRITNLREKITQLRQLGIDYVVIAKFDEHFRRLSAIDFATILKNKLNATSLVIGDDFRFGYDRNGDSEFLQKFGFEVHNLVTVNLDGERISSTRIRQALAAHDFAGAARLLGRPYTMLGRVQHGDKIGRQLEFPTINIGLNRIRPCFSGIVAVDIACLTQPLTEFADSDAENGLSGYQPKNLLAAASIGLRPTIQQDDPKWRLEANLLDFSADLYGQLMQVTFLHYLHDEYDYPSLAALKQGIADDVRQIRQFRAEYNDIEFLSA